MLLGLENLQCVHVAQSPRRRQLNLSKRSRDVRFLRLVNGYSNAQARTLTKLFGRAPVSNENVIGYSVELCIPTDADKK